MGLPTEFPRVAVAGGPVVEFCVDPNAGDAVVPWLLQHDWIDEPVMRAFQSLVVPGARVLDLGCHLGLFALPAAALGAEVIAVDANEGHCRLLRQAARRNGFDRLDVVHAAVADASGPVRFVEQSIHGHAVPPGADEEDAITVPGLMVDQLLAERGWPSVDLIKIDIEGGEIGALRGMRALHAGGARPPMVFECNATMLPRTGESIRSLRGAILELGYELLMIDHLRPGVLIETPSADAVQPEAVCDYLAVAERPERFAPDWTIESPLTLEQTITRSIDSATGNGEGYRLHSAALINCGPDWFRDHPLIAPVRRALAVDQSAAVRAAVKDGYNMGFAAEHAGSEPPPEGGPPADVPLLATGVALEAGSAEPERARGQRPAELLLEDVSVHLRQGQLLAVLADQPDPVAALLRAFAGLERPLRGRLSLSATAVVLDDLAAGFEPGLGLAENIVVLGAFLGCDVGVLRRQAADLATRAGVGDQLDRPLAAGDCETMARIALAVALECIPARLLILGPLPALTDSGFKQWASGRLTTLRGDGAAVVQVVERKGELLGAADRALRIEDGRVSVCGHADSVFLHSSANPELWSAGAQL